MERNATYITLTEPLGYFSEFDAFRIQRCIQLLIGRHYLSQLTSNPVSSCQQLKSRYLDADGSALGSSVSHHHIEPQVTEQKDSISCRLLLPTSTHSSPRGATTAQIRAGAG
ncbi:Uncharacterized protein LW94_4404 [Fusarium fujikuroi]|nr:Uncharacterized protein LW93_10408 [Fusarium fujikuroi]KLP12633.1 Uncharacterized protein LW94_4404 [Fusarium fujikuroi]